MEFLLGSVFGIFLFLILRSFWCWYWKINRRIVLLESIEEKLAELINLQSHNY